MSTVGGVGSAPTLRKLNLFDAVPSLAASLGADELARARQSAVVAVADLRPGRWTTSTLGPHRPGDLGLLIVSGFMTRDVQLGGTFASELVGGDDLLRPTDHDGDEAPVPFAVGWQVLTPTEIAILDRRAAAALGQWPEAIEYLVRSCVKRARSLGLHLAVSHLRRVEPRVLVMLWHIADRWGRVTPAGVHVPLRLTHQTLGRLVGAQRPSVTTALRGLTGAGAVSRREDGSWLLHGEPPDLVAELRQQGDARASGELG